MGAKQAKITRGRPLMLNTADISSAPSDGYESAQDSEPLTAPHHVMSPRVLPGMRTTGLIIGLSFVSGAIVPAVAQPGGFELVLWVANPTGYFWVRTTPVFLNYRDASVTFDINAFPVYLQITASSVLTDGDIIFSLMEV